MSQWYSRPMVCAANLERALAFYTGTLGFTESWRHMDGDDVLVVQVERQGCELILSAQWPQKVGRGMQFVSLDNETFGSLRAELEAKGAPVESGWWGYRCLTVSDPDGNQLYFPDPDDPGGAQ